VSCAFQGTQSLLRVEVVLEEPVSPALAQEFGGAAIVVVVVVAIAADVVVVERVTADWR
jgi:hypothetical protein